VYKGAEKKWGECIMQRIYQKATEKKPPPANFLGGQKQGMQPQKKKAPSRRGVGKGRGGGVVGVDVSAAVSPNKCQGGGFVTLQSGGGGAETLR